MPALPPAEQRRAELAALIAQDPTGTGGTMQPTNMLPSWQQWSQANPLEQASVTAPPPPPPPPSQLPVDPNSAPMPAGPMPTYSQQQDQAAMPPGPVAPDPRRAALAQMLAQQQPGPMDPAAMGGPRVTPDFPLPGRKPPAPVNRQIAKSPAKRRITESDRLNAKSVADIIRRRLAKAQG